MAKHAGGRPKKELDVAQVKKIAAMQCPMSEIAAFFEVSVDTLERRYAEIIKVAREGAKCSLRKAQWDKAMSGNPAMLIWLGKHLLGQKDYEIPAEHQAEASVLFTRWAKEAREAKKQQSISPTDHETIIAA